MEQVKEEIKNEFNNKLKDIEKVDESKKKLVNTLCYTVAIILFICVLIGTVISINAYLEAKKQHDSANNVPSITFKKID